MRINNFTPKALPLLMDSERTALYIEVYDKMLENIRMVVEQTLITCKKDKISQ